jgi:hypothetical protein
VAPEAAQGTRECALSAVAPRHPGDVYLRMGDDVRRSQAVRVAADAAGGRLRSSRGAGPVIGEWAGRVALAASGMTVAALAAVLLCLVKLAGWARRKWRLQRLRARDRQVVREMERQWR